MKSQRILPEVFDDLRRARKYYDKEAGQELADRFIAAFRTRSDEILPIGDTFRPVYREFCRVMIEPFPYKIFFAVTKTEVVISLVIHAARNPKTVSRILRVRSES